MTTTIPAKISELQKGDVLIRLRDNNKCVFDSFTSEADGSTIVIFKGFAVPAKMMPNMFKNFEREYFIERETAQAELFDGGSEI